MWVPPARRGQVSLKLKSLEAEAGLQATASRGGTAANGASTCWSQPVSTPAAGADTAASAVTHAPPIRPINWALACAVGLRGRSISSWSTTNVNSVRCLPMYDNVDNTNNTASAPPSPASSALLQGPVLDDGSAWRHAPRLRRRLLSHHSVDEQRPRWLWGHITICDTRGSWYHHHTHHRTGSGERGGGRAKGAHLKLSPHLFVYINCAGRR